MGLEKIQSTFDQTKAAGRPALMPYWTLGYPNYETSTRVIEAIVAAGADMLELGVPFSDPLADGPVIQHASQVALENGITMQGCIDIARTLHTKGIKVPMLAMGYLNPLLAFGEKQYVEAWQSAGADG
ncbi:MAG TPA: tryptophan synthase subunit alpha, partial [Anaerolineae bacterium]